MSNPMKKKECTMKKLMYLVTLLVLTVFAGKPQAEDIMVYTEEFPPFNFTQNKKITGVSTEVVTRVFSDARLNTNIKSLAWSETYNLAQKQKNALIYSISRRKEREKLFQWIGVIVPTTYSVVALKSRKDIKISKLEDLKNYRIGTNVDDVVENWLLSKEFTLTDFTRTSGKNPALQLYKSLLNKHIDVWPTPDAQAYHVVRQQGHSDPSAVIQKLYPLEELSGGYYMAASLSTPRAVVDRLAQVLTSFKQTDDYYKILSHWGIEQSGARTSYPIAKLMYTMKSLSPTPIAKVGYLASDRLGSHREGGFYRKEMREDFSEYYVRSFKQWLQKFNTMQNEVDMIIIGSNKGITGWNKEKAILQMQSQTSVPTGTMIKGLSEYACVGFEANDMVVNLKIAKAAGFKIPKSFLRHASRLIE
jgi:polar amino acid transport system substrate-binding protein